MNTSPTLATFVLPFDSPDATLARVGGKGANLARLSRAGFPVPPGFLVATEAYHAYVAANELAAQLDARVAALDPGDPAALDAASAELRAAFENGTLPESLAGPIRAAYAALGRPPVAVRSSATAEDLPETSFAGQQDTYLNVVGDEALLRAVVRCWGSLWTARAMGYRARQGIGAEGLALAVVVQEMVASESSGVLFTANPLSGLRAETAIDATFGLGEALVSGQVEPDHYVVDSASGRVLEKTLGAKALILLPQPEGGIAPAAENAGEATPSAARQALPDEQIAALTALGQRVAAEYGTPQDIEWAWADNRLYLLQARPITSLYPVPDVGPDLAADELRVLFSFGAVQGVLDPLTPLGQDGLRQMVTGAATLFGSQDPNAGARVLRSAGDRLWADITGVVRHPVGRVVAREILKLVEPSVGQALPTIWDDPRLAPSMALPSPSFVLNTVRGLLRLLGRALYFLSDPERRRVQATVAVERFVADCAALAHVADELDTREALAARVVLVRELRQVFPELLTTVGAGLIGGLLTFNVLRKLVPARLPDGTRGEELLLELTRGLPHNVTTEMDLELWHTARALQDDPPAAAYLSATPAAQLAEEYAAGALPATAQHEVEAFMARYGFRGTAEIDLGRARWGEAPAPVFQALQNYLQIEDPTRAPDAVYARGARAAAEARTRLVEAVRAEPLGALKARVLDLLIGRMRASLGLRESPKFHLVRVLSLARQGLQASGRALAAEGTLAQADDVFYLALDELDQMAHGVKRDWAAVATGRRANYTREMRRRQVPRLLLSDGRAIYEGLRAAVGAGDAIVGSPVSPGVVEGVVHVVFDPHAAQLAPGEILVCPGTDPSWTPLFLAAGGLITEVGGMMTHGSVVAREYGIPAVVGVDQATRRLRTGQRIRVDGSSGRIELLDAPANAALDVTGDAPAGVP